MLKWADLHNVGFMEEEEEEEETVFIRGVNTNEDSLNAQHAPHRPRTGHRCNECVASLHA